MGVMTPRRIFLGLCLSFLVVFPLAGQNTTEIDDITGTYSFIKADDQVAILDQDGDLKGYVDVFQDEDESDVILSYTITIGSRKGTKVEFRTSTIHGLYYRFHGRVLRGEGTRPRDKDYYRLEGRLETTRRQPGTGEEKTERLRVIFYSLGDTGSD